MWPLLRPASLNNTQPNKENSREAVHVHPRRRITPNPKQIRTHHGAASSSSSPLSRPLAVSLKHPTTPEGAPSPDGELLPGSAPPAAARRRGRRLPGGARPERPGVRRHRRRRGVPGGGAVGAGVPAGAAGEGRGCCAGSRRGRRRTSTAPSTPSGYEELPYVGGAAPRTNVVGRVFTANESPPDQKIPFHHEMAQVSVSLPGPSCSQGSHFCTTTSS